MSYNYRFTARALKQQDEIITWVFRTKCTGDRRLCGWLYKIVDKICADPYRYRNTYKEFREFYWKKYHYHIIFFLDDDKGEVVIFSLYHSSSNPKNKYL